MSFTRISPAAAERLDAFAVRLLAARRAAGLTSREVAAQIGVTPHTLCQWESGRRKPSDVLLRAWAGALSIDVPEDVHGWTEGPAPCGTLAGSQVHVRRREPSCEPCRAVRRDYKRKHPSKGRQR